MATIYLFRHGQASFGSDDYDKLSELGERQAEVLGHYLRDNNVVLDAAYSGDLRRQRKTAELALASQPAVVEHHIDARFDEVRNDEHVEHLLPKLMEKDLRLQALMERGLNNSKDYQKIIEAVFTHWVSPLCDASNIQSWADYSGNASAALADVMRNEGSGKTVGIFTSGGTIATLVAGVLGLEGNQIYQFYEPIFNASMTQLFYNGDKVSLSYFNDCSFLRVLGQQAGENLISYR
jgi:broad specificity phosphatase PhoE